MSVTIYDIAKEVNLAASTVSRALKGNRDIRISEATRERIKRKADEMGYRPNAYAQALIMGKSNIIGLHVNSLEEQTGPHFARLLEAVEPKAREHGYSLVVSEDSSSFSGYVDGVVSLTSPLHETPGIPESLPVLHLWGSPRADDSPGVYWDDYEGAAMAIRYLVSLGHTRIAAFWGGWNLDSNDGVYPEKVVGYREAMTVAGLEMIEYYNAPGCDHYDIGYLQAKEMLERRRDITAVFARNDITALGVMRAVGESGLSVPGDISVVGYNDTPYARFAIPALTSVHTPISEAGKLALEMLVDKLANPEKEMKSVVLPIDITYRSSCAGRR